MSDILYTPPASGGGGGTTINPTNNFIPVRQNATTFVDSVLQCVPNTFVQSVRSGVGLGISTSFTLTTAETYIGDFNNLIDSKFIKVQNDTVTSRIYSSNSGFYLDFNGKTYRFGDYNNVNNGVFLNVDDQNRQVAFTDNNTIDGLFLNYSLNTYQLGQISNNTIFTIDAANNYAQIVLTSSQVLLVDVNNADYKIGDIVNYLGINQASGIDLLVANTQYFKVDISSNYLSIGNPLTGSIIYTDYNSDTITIGDYNGQSTQQLKFLVSQSSDVILTDSGVYGGEIGLLLNFNKNKFYLGDFNGLSNNTYLEVNNQAQTIHHNCENLTFQGTNLVNGSAGGPSPLGHLVVTINGVQCKIQLLNP